jgi:hypothetical protein
MLSTFCVEAAVLIMLFPGLDFWIEIEKASPSTIKRAPPMDIRSVMHWSATIGIGFLVASIIADMFLEHRGTDNH